MYSVIVITEDGVIYLLDLSLGEPKRIIDRLKSESVLSCALLTKDKFDYLSVSTASKEIYVF